MTDLVLAWDSASGEGDLCIAGADLAADDGLRTAVLVSLFTDRRAAADELPAGDTDRRGWWGDGLGQDQDEIGSKLWLLEREKQTPDVLVRAEAYAREALQWMLDDEVAVAVTVHAEWTRRGELGLRVAIQLPDGSSREFQFEDVLRAG